MLVRLPFILGLSLSRTANFNQFQLQSKTINHLDFFDEPKPPHGYNYWNDPRIHHLGNTGLSGAIHAKISPVISKILNNINYDGRDIRNEIYNEWANRNINVLDFNCGTGLSTQPGGTGVDISKEMIHRATKRNKRNDTNFIVGNSEDWGKSYGYDIVTCMFGFHEMPRSARLKVIENCIRVSGEKVVIIDIDPLHSPSSFMLSGEPYFLDYKKYIDHDMKLYGGVKKVIIEGRVVRWDFYKCL
jgi:SAM-dependent methyltransferase